MTSVTLSIGDQSIRFALDELSDIEALVRAAARHPGRELFRSSSSGRLAAILQETPPAQNSRATSNSFSEGNGSFVLLTDC
ncbi:MULTISPECIES: hypothetical protein [Pseudomonas]|uniref:hypothetical protein n=1 Tax=Pseudomonas TaxID=286 RepID=UPI000AC1E542|nr:MULTISPECIES: hypothetical protein [Pseudomonas]EIU3611517.1 hypothetical protein [Pseudomonas aeruginosa]EIU3817772.1 hypothetical protein [Pseudomonas aeruginosa]EIU3823868.1 hypothetical protein [Pseudomonas aeruginosa]EIU7173061.1 hypothetical protein [Pseudomonas aeruginosa]MBG5252889.1 hypothetical protein [Pseudomonas aeruginosa]